MMKRIFILLCELKISHMHKEEQNGMRIAQQIIMLKAMNILKLPMKGKEFLSLGEAYQSRASQRETSSGLYLTETGGEWRKALNTLKRQRVHSIRLNIGENKAQEITLAMPESIEYFSDRLEKAIAFHKGLKDGSIEKEHSYSLAYANKEVKELKKKVENAKLLWGN